jgi:hypothetical protein
VVSTVASVLGADVFARVTAVIAILLAFPGWWFAYKSHQREVERRADEKRRDADEELRRKSADLRWSLRFAMEPPRGMTTPVNLFVENVGGATAEGILLWLDRGEDGTDELTVANMAAGQTSLVRESVASLKWPDRYTHGWSVRAEWTDGRGRQEAPPYALTYVNDPR